MIDQLFQDLTPNVKVSLGSTTQLLSNIFPTEVRVLALRPSLWFSLFCFFVFTFVFIYLGEERVASLTN